MKTGYGKKVASRDKRKSPKLEDMIAMFDKINKDELSSGGRPGIDNAYRPLTDWEYYSDQIENIYGVSMAKARELAKQMAEFAKKRGKEIEINEED